MTIAFRSICWVLASYFLVVAHMQSGFPAKEWSGSSGISLAIAIFLTLLPFAKSLSLGELFKFEAKIEEVKKDVEVFKAETRNMLNLQSSILTKITSNVGQHTTINLPPLSEAY